MAIKKIEEMTSPVSKREDLKMAMSAPDPMGEAYDFYRKRFSHFINIFYRHYVLLPAPKPFTVIKPLFGDVSIETTLSFFVISAFTSPPALNPCAFNFAVASFKPFLCFISNTPFVPLSAVHRNSHREVLQNCLDGIA